VFCQWPNSKVGRPVIILFVDVRTRLILAFAVVQYETADAIRSCLRKAIEKWKAISHEVSFDNGRGFCSQLLSGGQPTRYRRRGKPDDILGIFTLLDVKVSFVMPEHGQSKLIERIFNTLTKWVDKHEDFRGAYCGNSPSNRPEEFDSKKAVPIEKYISRLEIEIDRYNQESHSGQGMDGRSPLEVYEELSSKDGAKARRPTQGQLHLCMLAAERVTLGQECRDITLLGNRYYHEKLADLRSRGPYTVRYDPEDATVPVAVYDGGRFICEAPLVAATGFRDQQAKKEHNRARRLFAKGRKIQDKAQRDILDAKRFLEPDPPTPEIPHPKVIELLQTRLQQPVSDAKREDDIDVDAALRKIYGGS
jgi:putative transposase